MYTICVTKRCWSSHNLWRYSDVSFIPKCEENSRFKFHFVKKFVDIVLELALIGSLKLSTSNLRFSNQQILGLCFCASFLTATAMILQRIAKIRIRRKHHFDFYLVYLFLLNVFLSGSINGNGMQQKQNAITINLRNSQEKVCKNRATWFIRFLYLLLYTL